jgi:tRNA(Ile)-lysidine synthase
MDNSVAMQISDDELSSLFSGFLRFRLVLLAVSGGADSMALMHLVARWRALTKEAGRAVPLIEVATVDHGLRPQSADEANAVGRASAALGFCHHLLSWTGEKPHTQLQEAARSARYALLARCLSEAGHRPAALVTAHTSDDQAETLLMRLARGSGLDGLSAIVPERPMPADSSFMLLRPLLTVPKARLVRTLQAAGMSWMEDPSNERAEFERVRIRQAHGVLTAIGIENDRLALSAHRLGRARQAIEIASRALFARVADLHDGMFARIDLAAMSTEPEELRLRVLQRSLRIFGGAARPARLSQVEALLASLDSGKTVAQTLGGCLVVAKANQLRISREPGRAPPDEIRLALGQCALWDNRFEVRVASADAGARALTVRALGRPAYTTLCAGLSKRPCPASAGAMLPSFWDGETLVAVPPLGSQIASARGPLWRGFAMCTAKFVGMETGAESE